MYHEIYGKYYQIIHNLLNSKPQTEKEINDYIRSQGFDESFLYLNAQMLVDEYHLFVKKRDLFYPLTNSKIPLFLTNEQRSWLNTMLFDEKVKLFLSDERRNYYQKEFAGNVLYDDKTYQYLFQDVDKDEITPKMSNVFRVVKNAIMQEMDINLTFISSKNYYTHKKVAPYKIEYSMQDQKMRLIAVEYRNGEPKRIIRIKLASIVGYRMVERVKKIDFKYYLQEEVLKEPLIIEVYPILNGIERVFIELSNYKREAFYDKERNLSIMKIYYEKVDEMDLVLKMLSFGKVVKILSDGFIKEEVLRRINKQKELLSKVKKKN